MSKKAKRKQVNQEALMEAFHFNQHDLLANQEGYLSERQRRSIKTPNKMSLQDRLQALNIVFIAAIFILFFVVMTGFNIVFGSLVGIGLVYWLISKVNNMADVEPRKQKEITVTSVVGRARIAVDYESKYPMQGVLIIGSHTFWFSMWAYHLLEAGAPYRVYFMPVSDRILSIERLTAIPPPKS